MYEALGCWKNWG